MAKTKACSGCAFKQTTEINRYCYMYTDKPKSCDQHTALNSINIIEIDYASTVVKSF